MIKMFPNKLTVSHKKSSKLFPEIQEYSTQQQQQKQLQRLTHEQVQSFLENFLALSMSSLYIHFMQS